MRKIVQEFVEYSIYITYTSLLWRSVTQNSNVYVKKLLLSVQYFLCQTSELTANFIVTVSSAYLAL
jgi:hypothetical protein